MTWRGVAVDVVWRAISARPYLECPRGALHGGAAAGQHAASARLHAPVEPRHLRAQPGGQG